MGCVQGGFSAATATVPDQGELRVPCPAMNLACTRWSDEEVPGAGWTRSRELHKAMSSLTPDVGPLGVRLEVDLLGELEATIDEVRSTAP